MEIAKTILQQLGGQGRLIMFTGANNFVALKNGVTFKIKNRKVNFIKITLNSLDLYDVYFYKLAAGNLKLISEHNDIYFDELIPLFEKQTGMYLSLYMKGGKIKNDESRDMIFSQLKQIHHHEKELKQIIAKDDNIEPWVIAKMQRATTDLADITHYEDGKTDKMAKGGGIIPASGILTTKDKKNKLDYKKIGDNYEFVVYDGEPNPVENYSRVQYKKRDKNKVLMNYNQFVNYLYSEGYIDDKMKSGGKFEDGGVLGFNYDIVIDNKPLIQIFKDDYLERYNVFYYLKKDKISTELQRILKGKKSLSEQEANTIYGELLKSNEIGKTFTVEVSKLEKGGEIEDSEIKEILKDLKQSYLEGKRDLGLIRDKQQIQNPIYNKEIWENDRGIEGRLYQYLKKYDIIAEKYFIYVNDLDKINNYKTKIKELKSNGYSIIEKVSAPTKIKNRLYRFIAIKRKLEKGGEVNDFEKGGEVDEILTLRNLLDKEIRTLWGYDKFKGEFNYYELYIQEGTQEGTRGGFDIHTIKDYEEAVKKYYEESKKEPNLVTLYGYHNGSTTWLISNSAFFVINDTTKEIASIAYDNKNSANSRLIEIIKAKGDTNYSVKRIYKNVTKTDYGYAKGGKIDEDLVIFSVDDEELDTLLHNNYHKNLDYITIKNDEYYTLNKRDFDRFIDSGDSNGFDVDYENSEDAVVYVIENVDKKEQGGEIDKTDLEYSLRLAIENTGINPVAIKSVKKSGDKYTIVVSSYIGTGDLIIQLNKILNSSFEIIDGSLSKTISGNKIFKIQEVKKEQGGSIEDEKIKNLIQGKTGVIWDREFSGEDDLSTKQFQERWKRAEKMAIKELKAEGKLSNQYEQGGSIEDEKIKNLIQGKTGVIWDREFSGEDDLSTKQFQERWKRAEKMAIKELKAEGKLSNQYEQGGSIEDVKESLLNDNAFTKLLFNDEIKFLRNSDTKVIKRKSMLIITDGKREMLFNSTNPISKIKKLGNASNSTKELYKTNKMKKGGKIDLSNEIELSNLLNDTVLIVFNKKTNLILEKGKRKETIPFNKNEEIEVELFDYNNDEIEVVFSNDDREHTKINKKDILSLKEAYPIKKQYTKPDFDFDLPFELMRTPHKPKKMEDGGGVMRITARQFTDNQIKDFDDVKKGDICTNYNDDLFEVITKGYGSDYDKILKKYDNGMISQLKYYPASYGMEKGDFEELPFIVVKDASEEFSIFTYEESGALVYVDNSKEVKEIIDVIDKADVWSELYLVAEDLEQFSDNEAPLNKKQCIATILYVVFNSNASDIKNSLEEQGIEFEEETPDFDFEDVYFKTEGDYDEEYLEFQDKLKILRKYIDFDNVTGSSDSYETYLTFEKNGVKIANINGEYDSKNSKYTSYLSIGGNEVIIINFHPYGSMGGFDSDEFEKQVKQAVEKTQTTSIIPGLDSSKQLSISEIGFLYDTEPKLNDPYYPKELIKTINDIAYYKVMINGNEYLLAMDTEGNWDDKWYLVSKSSLNQAAIKEPGSAEIKIGLENGNVTVTHATSGEVLLNLQNVPKGTWDKLWDFLKNDLV